MDLLVTATKSNRVLTKNTALRILEAALISGASVAFLAGCTSNTELSVFSTDRTSSDELPASANALNDDVDLVTSRALWTDNAGRQFYAALGVAPDVKCLITIENDEATASCSTTTPLMLTFTDGTKLSLGALAPTDEGWIEVATNLWASG